MFGQIVDETVAFATVTAVRNTTHAKLISRQNDHEDQSQNYAERGAISYFLVYR